MQLFYNPRLDNSASQFVFDAVEGDTLQITNGKGYLFEARIVDADVKKCKAEIISTTKKHRKMYWFHLVVAPTKNNDRFEWFLDKATEIGVNEITPIICERMEKVIQSAMKQSLQAYLPKLNKAVTFKEFIDQPREGLLFIAHCDDDEKMELKRRVAPDKDITILIGPEGDFSRQEIITAYENGFLPVSLGENRLRTETAAIVACTTVNMINNG